MNQEQTERLMAENERLRFAVLQSIIAIDDWLNLYAEAMCDAKRVAEARERINAQGTIGYIADVQKINRTALSGAPK